MNNSEPYFMQLEPPPLDGGLFGADDTTPAVAHIAPLQATEREEMAQADATRLEHMAKRVKPVTIEERFAEFVRQHPDVVEAVVKVCRQMKAAGADRWSIDAAWHVVRYQYRTSAHSGGYGRGDYSLNNDYTAPMARLIMARCPDLSGFFETRKSKVTP